MDLHERQHLSDQVARLAEGERALFNDVFSILLPILHRYCARYLGDKVQGEDAAQNALLKIFRKLHTYDPKRDALTWSLSIATWECRSKRQQLRRHHQKWHEMPLDMKVNAAGTDEIMSIRSALADVLGQVNEIDVQTLFASAGLIDRPLIPSPIFRKRLQRARSRAQHIWRSLYGNS